MSEHSVSVDYSYVLRFQSRVRGQEEKSHRFGFFIEKEDSLTDLGSTLSPATSYLQDLGQVI